MKILIVADGRSPIARNWINLVQEQGHEVSLVSTYSCAPIPDVVYLKILPVAFGRFAGSQVSTGAHVRQKNSLQRRLVGVFRNGLVAARYWLGPLFIGSYRRKFIETVGHIKPDLVHALRLPFEGMLASFTPTNVPLIVSIWGNDLTLHAHRNGTMMKQTKKVLTRANGLVADAHRDIRLAGEMGFNTRKPSLVVPGGGGIDLEKILKKHKLTPEMEAMIPKNVPLVVNPRGFRPGSVRNDVFFRAAALVLQSRPDVQFICAAMAGQAEAINWVRKLGITDNVHLMPYLTQEELWAVFQRCQVSVSVSEHDGTPNSLLEAMALGCFPICGDIESIREWISDGVNGLLVNSTKPDELAKAILRALDDKALRENARSKGMEVIKAKADIVKVGKAVGNFYKSFNR